MEEEISHVIGRRGGRSQMVKALGCCPEEPEFHTTVHGQCLKDHLQVSSRKEKQSLTRLKWGEGCEAEQSISPELIIQRRERNKKSRSFNSVIASARSSKMGCSSGHGLHNEKVIHVLCT